MQGGARTPRGPAAVTQQRQKLWENYFPGTNALEARYKQVRCKRFGVWAEAPALEAQPCGTMHRLIFAKQLPGQRFVGS